MIKFFLDANIPYSSKQIFKSFGTVEHARDAGLSRAADKEILKYAVKNKSILVTKDLEFGNILIYPIKSHRGVIILRLPFYYTAEQINKALVQFLKSVELEEIRNSITVVELGRYRIRK
jgi:predicted nuclease of predicted toxin-antitoxin system